MVFSSCWRRSRKECARELSLNEWRITSSGKVSGEFPFFKFSSINKNYMRDISQALCKDNRSRRGLAAVST